MAGDDESRRYVVGPSIEVKLPSRFAVEANALYQRLGNLLRHEYPGATPPRFFELRQRGNSWEFPLLGKYYFTGSSSRLQPFLGTGYALRTISFTNNISSFSGEDERLTSPRTYDDRSGLHVGAVVTGGIGFRVGALTVSPQFRYTRWSENENFVRKNQTGAMFGIHF